MIVAPKAEHAHALLAASGPPGAHGVLVVVKASAPRARRAAKPKFAGTAALRNVPEPAMPVARGLHGRPGDLAAVKGSAPLTARAAKPAEIAVLRAEPVAQVVVGVAGVVAVAKVSVPWAPPPLRIVVFAAPRVEPAMRAVPGEHGAHAPVRAYALRAYLKVKPRLVETVGLSPVSAHVGIVVDGMHGPNGPSAPEKVCVRLQLQTP